MYFYILILFGFPSASSRSLDRVSCWHIIIDFKHTLLILNLMLCAIVALFKGRIHIAVSTLWQGDQFHAERHLIIMIASNWPMVTLPAVRQLCTRHRCASNAYNLCDKLQKLKIASFLFLLLYLARVSQITTKLSFSSKIVLSNIRFIVYLCVRPMSIACWCSDGPAAAAPVPSPWTVPMSVNLVGDFQNIRKFIGFCSTSQANP